MILTHYVLMLFLLSVLNVSFPLVTYTVAEDAGPVSVCVTSERQLSGGAANLSLYTSDGTATDSGGGQTISNTQFQ